MPHSHAVVDYRNMESEALWALSCALTQEGPMAKRLLERTDGRRKGYSPFRSNVNTRLDDATKAKLEALSADLKREEEA